MRPLWLSLFLAGCVASSAPASPQDAASEAGPAAEVASLDAAAAVSANKDAIESVLCDASCDDGNPCTNDLCLVKVGCAHIPRQGPCDDGNACTIQDMCAEATCTGAPQAGC